MAKINPVREPRSLTTYAGGSIKPPPALKPLHHRLKSAVFSNGINAKYTLFFGIPKDTFFAVCKNENILFCEMRPNLSGAKLLADKLRKNKIKSTLVCDNALGNLFFLNRIKKVYLFSLKNNTFAPGAQAVKILADWHHIPLEINEGGEIKTKNLPDKNAATFLGKKVTIKKIRVINPQNESLNQTTNHINLVG